MYVIRPITLDDFETYAKFAFAARLGMASMPKNREELKKNIQSSLNAFSFSSNSSENRFYLFVLENVATKEIGGTCGIFTKIGVDPVYYYYRGENLHQKPYNQLPIPQEMKILKAVALTEGLTEICSLYLALQFRKEGLGRLLSLSRFLFMASFPENFNDTIIAEMRGFIDQNNKTPFWDHLGRHFLDLDYAEVQHIKDYGRQFIPYVLPQYPIYVDMLPEEAKNMIGRVHENTRPALKILEQEGFVMTQDYDVFDGGPVIKANKNSIRTIKECVRNFVSGMTSQPIESEKYIVSNGKLSFRCCYSNLSMTKDQGVVIPKETADALLLQEGDPISFSLPFKKE
jgi:arginine N-succinyltransferase